MLEKIASHQHIKHLVLYSVIFFVFGAFFNNMGPFIPYLSAVTHEPETYYSYLLTCRSFGMLAGAFICKYFQKIKLTNHRIMLISMVGICIFSALFTYTTDSFWLGFWLFLMGSGITILEILLNICVLAVNLPEQIEFWMIITHVLFGLGGLLGPLFVFLFETKVFLFLGILLGIGSIFCHLLATPENLEVKRNGGKEDSTQLKSIFLSMEICLCLLLFLYMGSECTYGGWISSFAEMNHVADKKGATIYSSIFWIFMTVTRFLMIFVPSSVSTKVKIFIISYFFSGVISLLLIYLRYIKLACYVSAVLFGMSLSTIYALMFALPIDQGYKIQDSQATNIVLAATVAEGILAAFTGDLMRWISLNMLFFSLTFFSLLMGAFYYLQVFLVDQNAKENENCQFLQIEKEEGKQT